MFFFLQPWKKLQFLRDDLRNASFCFEMFWSFDCLIIFTTFMRNIRWVNERILYSIMSPPSYYTGPPECIISKDFGTICSPLLCSICSRSIKLLFLLHHDNSNNIQFFFLNNYHINFQWGRYNIKRKMPMKSWSSYLPRRPQKLTKSSPSIWNYVVSVKLTVEIFSIFAAFFENTNFKKKHLQKLLWITIFLSWAAQTAQTEEFMFQNTT